jgi:hypothetical protein
MLRLLVSPAERFRFEHVEVITHDQPNFRGTPEDRFTAWRDHRRVQWKMAILNGINPNPPHDKLSEETIESFKAGLTEERVDFQFWMTDANGERCLGEMVFVASREVVLARREARRLRGG